MTVAGSAHGARTAASKADFSGIYTAPDPRPYFGALTPLDYQVPAHAAPVLRAALRPGRPVLDLCCSYGVNAALLRTTAGLDEVAARYTDPALRELSGAELAAADATYFGDRTRPDAPSVVGLDASAPAIAYGRAAGLFADGFVEDLERDDPSPRLAAALTSVGTVVCTGGVGYIGVATFRRLLAHLPSDVRLVVYVLRTFGYAEIAAVLAEHGLQTRRLPDSVRQRRFADGAERDAAVADVRARGLDPAGREEAGWFYADCHLSSTDGAAG